MIHLPMKGKFGIISMQANTNLIQRTISYYIFAKTIKNTFSNFIRHETILSDDRDPPWIGNKIKKLINEENTAYQFYAQNGKNEQSFQVFQAIQNMLLSAIEVSKQ